MVTKAFCVFIEFLLNDYLFILIFEYFEIEHTNTLSDRWHAAILAQFSNLSSDG